MAQTFSHIDAGRDRSDRRAWVGGQTDDRRKSDDRAVSRTAEGSDGWTHPPSTLSAPYVAIRGPGVGWAKRLPNLGSTTMFEILRADFARDANKGLAVRLTLAIFRLGQHSRGGPLRALWILVDRAYVRTVIGAEIPSSVRCGPGLALPHAGRGLTIHPETKIGRNCMIFHRVTLGATALGAPVLGDDVIVGTGACVLGGVHVGSGAKIGANAVVVSDVPAGATVHAAPVVVRD